MAKKFSNGWMLNGKEKDYNRYHKKSRPHPHSIVGMGAALLLKYIEVACNYSITGLNHLSASSSDMPLRLA
jgi:hypothetical protein